MRVLSALFLSAAVPCFGEDEAAKYHKVSRREAVLPKFDRSVLGNSASSKGPPTFVREHMFIADISVGTPPQTMKCLLDSGTADIWIPSRRCRSCEQGHHFRADKSETFMPAVAKTEQGLMPVPVRMDYKTGEVVGFLVQDTIGLGWGTIPNQSFLIVEEAKLPEHREWDGICGLGWHQMAAEETGQPLYRHFQPMYKNMEGRTDVKPVFSLVPSIDRQAYLVVGDAPTAAIKEDSLVWLQAQPLEDGHRKSFWVVEGSIAVGDQSALATRFVVDTASPFLLAPRQLFADFVRAMFPAGHFEKNCGSDPNADNLVVCECDGFDHDDVLVYVNLGDRGFRLNYDMLFKRVPVEGGEELCLLTVQPNPLSSVDPMELLGDLLTARPGESSAELESSDGGSGEQPFVMPALPFLIPIAQALSNATFMKGHGGGAPMSIAVPQSALPNGPILPPIPGEEQVEEIRKANPDGTVCDQTLVWGDKGLKRNTTICRDKDGKEVKQRRLSASVLDDVWVLGGPFLEHFVTIMDFEKGQIGFAEPTMRDPADLERAVRSAKPGSTEALVSDSNRLSTAHAGPTDAEDVQSQGGGFPWGALVLLTCLAGAGGACYHIQQKTKTRKNFSTPFGDGVNEDQPRLDVEAVAAE